MHAGGVIVALRSAPELGDLAPELGDLATELG